MNSATPQDDLAELGCITVSNDGPHVIDTNYFDTSHTGWKKRQSKTRRQK